MLCRIYEWFRWYMSGLGGMSGFYRIRVVSVEGKWFVEYRSGLGGKRVV